MGNEAASPDGDLRIHKRVLQSVPMAFSTGPGKPGRFRTKGGLKEHRKRHENGTRPFHVTQKAKLSLKFPEILSLYLY